MTDRQTDRQTETDREGWEKGVTDRQTDSMLIPYMVLGEATRNSLHLLDL